MTEEAESWLIETCTITDPGTVSNTDSGGTEITSPVAYTSVPCRRTRASTQSVRGKFSEQLTVSADYLFSTRKTQPLEVGWTVTANGVTYHVTEVAEAGTIGTIKRALIEKVSAVGG